MSGFGLRSLRMRVRRAWRDESGTATIPFVIFFPFMITLVVSSLELGFVMTRHVMLERAVDLSVRDLRLNLVGTLTHDEFKQIVCDRSALIENCENVLMIELRKVDTTTWEPLAAGATCTEEGQYVSPPGFEQGGSDELMLIRACAKFKPIFPMTGLGLDMPKDSAGYYALVTSSAFVNEPILGASVGGS